MQQLLTYQNVLKAVGTSARGVNAHMLENLMLCNGES